MKHLLCASALCALLACSACAHGPPPEIPGMAHLEGGRFKMGYEKGQPNEKPARDVEMDHGFYIDVYEVTNEEYKKFIDDSKRAAPATWKDGKFADGEAKLPVSSVSWEDAKAYCAWAGKRLPTEPEWEYAARGKDGRLFPWGNDWAPGKCNNFESGKNAAVEVGTFKEGKGPFGTFDQAGNVWEWTSTESADGVMIKGGSYKPLEDRPRTSLRQSVKKATASDKIGFRCAKDE